MTSNPDFVDNRSGNTLQKAVVDQLESIRNDKAAADELWIATAYFNPGGLELLAKETDHVGSIRLLLGAEPTPESSRPRRQPGDLHEPAFTEKMVAHALTQLQRGLAEDRNLLPFDRESKTAVSRLLDFLRSGKIEVRRYTKRFLHAKAYIFRAHSKGFIAGSSNLTYAGMRTNFELNLGQYDNAVVDKVENWYEELWEDAEPFDLAAIYEALLEEFPPYLISMVRVRSSVFRRTASAP